MENVENEQHNAPKVTGCDVPGWVARETVDYSVAAGTGSSQNWEGNARIYQWDEEFGDVGPKLPELELELFGDPAHRHERTGMDFSK